MPRDYAHWIDGSWSRPNGASIERFNPANGALLARYGAGDAATVDRAVAAARSAFDRGPWPRMPGMERGAALMRLASLMRRDLEQLAILDCQEVGKPIGNARGDIELAIGLVEIAAGLAPVMHGETYSTLGPKRLGLVWREPLGVAGLIVPWNFPACILCQKLPSALAAGCTVVVKPSEYTSSSALEIAVLAKEAGIPDGVLNVVTGYGDPAGQRLAEHSDVDIVSFTGSTVTGRRILDAARGNLKKVALELGGKGASIVFADADLEEAVDGSMLGNFANQGEVCCSVPRVFVERSVAKAFTECLVERVGKVRVGDPFADGTQVGALIHPNHLQKVLGHVDASRKAGARVAVGGKRLGGSGFDQGCFMEPAVVEITDDRLPIFVEEVFGPVMCVRAFDSADDIVGLVNATSYGLSNAIWTKDLDRAMTTARDVRSGNVWINCALDVHANLPFGGYKGSGHGREMGQYGLDEFTQVKNTVMFLGARDRVYQ